MICFSSSVSPQSFNASGAVVPSARMTVAWMVSLPCGDCLPDVRHEHAVTDRERKFRSLRQGKGQDAPVYAVGAVALGGVLIAYVAEAAQHLLSGCRLLPRGAVSRLVGEQAGAELRLRRQRIRVTDSGQNGTQVRRQLSGAACRLLRRDCLGASTYSGARRTA